MKVYLVWENYYDFANNWVKLKGVFKDSMSADHECIRLTSLLPKGDRGTEYYYNAEEVK